MSGTERIDSKLSAAYVDASEEKVLGQFLNRIAIPLLRALLSSVNRLSGSVSVTTVAITLDGSEGFVPVDASAAPVTVTLSVPTALFHPLIVQKIDSSGNAVTVAAPAGVTVRGAASLALAAQWDRLIIVADDSKFYA